MSSPRKLTAKVSSVVSDRKVFVRIRPDLLSTVNLSESQTCFAVVCTAQCRSFLLCGGRRMDELHEDAIGYEERTSIIPLLLLATYGREWNGSQAMLSTSHGEGVIEDDACK